MSLSQINATLQDFQIIQKIGEGSYSTVYKVKRTSDGKLYAMKKVKLSVLKDKEKENALNEVRILASLNDQHIVNYKEAFFEDQSMTLYLIMEFTQSGDLQKKIDENIKNKTYFPETEIWKALVHMTKGLKVLHDMKILHRDLKCANIFISKEGNYKLGDMNVSKVAKNSLVYTQTGTPYYASPEVWRDEPYDMRSDIWSLGCLVYEMAALKPPFRAQNMDGLYKRVQKGIFERIPSRYSKDLQQIIQTCLQLNSKSRPNCDQILNHPLVLKNIGEEFSTAQNKNQHELLQTIKLPKNLNQLKGKFPKSNYEGNTKSLKENYQSKSLVNQSNNQTDIIDKFAEQQRKKYFNTPSNNQIDLSIHNQSNLLNDVKSEVSYKSKNNPYAKNGQQQQQYAQNQENSINRYNQQMMPNYHNLQKQYKQQNQQQPILQGGQMNLQNDIYNKKPLISQKYLQANEPTYLDSLAQREKNLIGGINSIDNLNKINSQNQKYLQNQNQKNIFNYNYQNQQQNDINYLIQLKQNPYGNPNLLNREYNQKFVQMNDKPKRNLQQQYNQPIWWG